MDGERSSGLIGAAGPQGAGTSATAPVGTGPGEAEARPAGAPGEAEARPAGAEGQPGVTVGSRRGRLRPTWIPTTALVVYLVCRALTVAVVAVANRFTHNSLLYDLDIWDGEWFLRVVRHGYPAHLPVSGGHVAANPIAFFPAFPLLVRAVSSVGLDPGAVAVVVSGVTGLTAVIAVGLLARRLAGDAAGERAALLFALCPGAFAFSLAYAEGLFLTVVALGLVALCDRRWLAAGLLGAVATATTPVGLAFVAACGAAAAADVLRRRRPGALVAPLLAPVGFVAYMAYLWAHTGTLAAWRLTERGGWKSYPSLRYPVRIVWTFVSDPLQPTLTGHILFFGTVAAVVGCVLMVKERQPLCVLTYGFCAAGLAAISQPVGLRPRFLLLAFPMVVALGTRYTGTTHRVLVAASAVLLAAATVLELASRAVFP